MKRRSAVLAALTASILAVGTAIPATAATDPPPEFTATALTPSEAPTDSARTKTGRLAESDSAVIGRTDGQVITAMIKVDVDPVASYTGDVEGFAATSPEVTGKKLSLSDPAVAKYLQHVESVLADAQKGIAAAVPSTKVLSSYAIAYGGLAVTVPARDAKLILGVPGVAAVQDNARRSTPTRDSGATLAGVAASGPALAAGGAAPLDNDASTFVGADKVWPALGGRDHAGQGVIIGVLDTGIWPEHPMLADNGIPTPPGGLRDCEFGIAGDAAFACNDKLVGARAFLDTQIALESPGAADFCTATACSPRDSDGHGTHTATTAAGSYVQNAPIFGVDRGPVSGIAPGASIIAYRVCIAGCYTSDSTAAVQQAILDGVDVINFSISGGGSAYTDAVELAFLDAFAAGITVNVSAGNAGPGAATADHAGPWLTTVAASTFDRAFTSTLTLTSSDGTSFSKGGATLTSGVTNAPVVLAQNVPGYTGGAICSTPFAAGSLTGQVVACERGGTGPNGPVGRVEKGFYATQGGAAGLILYNPTASDTETDNHFLPAIHLEGPNAELVAYISGHPDVTATWAAGQSTKAAGDVMAGFSSRGPLGDFLKPDVTAPGVQVLAGHTPESTDLATGPQGELFQAIAGTSMSSPHAAGVSLLVKAAHPTWTPGQVKSALMTSSVQSVVNPDGSAAGVFDRGAGSIRADRAVAPSLTISETAANFAASATNPNSRQNLNIASVNVNPLPGAAIVKRTVTNATSGSLTFTAKGTNADGLQLIVAPLSFTLKAGASREITIILNGIKATDGWHTGQVTLTPSKSGAIPVVLPVAANVGDAAIALTQSCTPSEIARGKTTTCTVSASSQLPVDVDAKIDVVANPLLQVTSVTAPAKKQLLGATWKGTLAGAKAPTITGVAPGTSPAGYLPLSLFGIAPTPGLGDETIANFNVPNFLYGGEVYNRIGITSNGYAVVGGGTSADVEFEPHPDDFPNPAAPNNVLAPYWTDLNFANGGAFRAGTLTDGVNTWLVLDWDAVALYGQPDKTNSFQIWIGVDGTEDISFTYGTLNRDASYPTLTGAENRDGSSGATAPNDSVAEGTELRITTTPPVAGGAVTFDYTLKGLIKGTWTTAATLQSSALNVIPVETTKITVK
ncbi:S8 family serine peptidase [Microbacterium ulmi]|uniref:S8 family serine peptidase n=1 Tax=Microbacterium ulmi TaxID=179095 RepID=A0A7Y2M1E4_9MICO|nr:S8 family serine peptidase [Microbacterium ulmi]NII71000.1 subtilisin family serine protease [Microbacterium ulmi]NNH04234.1 S8 family serine peptidase [Microbacterium ulmi]